MCSGKLTEFGRDLWSVDVVCVEGAGLGRSWTTWLRRLLTSNKWCTVDSWNVSDPGKGVSCLRRKQRQCDSALHLEHVYRRDDCVGRGFPTTGNEELYRMLRHVQSSIVLVPPVLLHQYSMSDAEASATAVSLQHFSAFTRLDKSRYTWLLGVT